MRRRLLTLGLCWAWGCSGAPLPDDLSRAQALEAAQRDAEALAAYQQVRKGCGAPGIRPHDDCGVAAFRAAQLLERLERYDEAAAAFRQVRDLTVDGRLAGRALLRAAALYADRLSRRDEALRLLGLVVRRWPDEVPAEDALRLLVALRADDPGLDADLDQLAEELQRHSVSGWALLYRAERAARAGQKDAAVARYDELWRRFPRGPLRDDAAYRAAGLLREIGRPQAAAERLERLERTFKRALFVGHYNQLLLDDAALLLGQVYLEDLGQPDRAIAALRGLLARQPESLLCDDALLWMARAALRRHTPPQPGDSGEACGYLQQLVRDYPQGNQVRHARALGTEVRCPGEKK